MIKTSTPLTPLKDPFKLLLIGPPGSRKTTFALQFPGIYVEDCDRNLKGPESYLREHWKKDFTYAYNPVRYTDAGIMREIDECYDSLCSDLQLIAKQPKDYEQFQTIFIDSLSHVNEFIIRHVLKLQNKSKRVFEMEARDWSPFKSFAYILLVARLEQMNKNVICSCHEVKLVEPDGANVMKERVIGYEPFFQGKVGDIIGGFFTDVWRMELQAGGAGTLKTILQTQRIPRCEHLKNSLGMPAEIDVSKGFVAIELYLKAKGYYV